MSICYCTLGNTEACKSCQRNKSNKVATTISTRDIDVTYYQTVPVIDNSDYSYGDCSSDCGCGCD